MKITKKWHIGFFGGVIGLNVLILFRAAAFQEGGMIRGIWTAIVVAMGVFMLFCLYQIRSQRLK